MNFLQFLIKRTNHQCAMDQGGIQANTTRFWNKKIPVSVQTCERSFAIKASNKETISKFNKNIEEM